jgi:hypothetical protein
MGRVITATDRVGGGRIDASRSGTSSRPRVVDVLAAGTFLGVTPPPVPSSTM